MSVCKYEHHIHFYFAITVRKKKRKKLYSFYGSCPECRYFSCIFVLILFIRNINLFFHSKVVKRKVTSLEQRRYQEEKKAQLPEKDANISNSNGIFQEKSNTHSNVGVIFESVICIQHNYEDLIIVGKTGYFFTPIKSPF